MHCDQKTLGALCQYVRISHRGRFDRDLKYERLEGNILTDSHGRAVIAILPNADQESRNSAIVLE